MEQGFRRRQSHGLFLARCMRMQGPINRLILPAVGMALLLAARADAAGDVRLVEAARRGDWTSTLALVKQGVDVNVRHPDGATALTWAVYHDNLAAIDRLIAAGANVNVASEHGETPLSVACRNRSTAAALRLLKAGANPNLANSDGETVLMAIADMGGDGAADNLDLAKLLIAHGAQVDAREALTGQTALMWAAVRGDLPVAKALVAAGADIHATTRAGSTPLHFAVQQGAMPVAQLLLDAGANPNATMTARQIDQEAQAYVEVLTGVTPLWLATTIRHEALGALLLERGANPNAGQYRGIPPLHFAVQGRMESLTRALLKHGANPNARAPESAYPPKGGNENLIGHKTFYLMPVGATPYFLAAQIRDAETMRLLLAAGADPKIPDAEGTTPLMAATGVTDARFRQPAPRRRATPEEVLEAATLAVEHGAPVNAANDSAQTALHGASAARSLALVEFLLGHGAKTEAWNLYGERPVEIATRDRTFITDPTLGQQLDTMVTLLGGGAAASASR